MTSREALLPPVIAYVTEEVRRQGHDLATLDGIERVAWMLEAWAVALRVPISRTNLSLSMVADLGSRVEAVKNMHGFRVCGVRVGSRICPPASQVIPRLHRLLDSPPADPLEFYREFEEIHPFVDGNGRTGKILLNALNGTLLNPIFPPDDFWGEGIMNP